MSYSSELCRFRRLLDAIVRGDLNAVTKLWKDEFIYERNINGRSSLHCACRYDKSGDIVKFLLESGEDIEGGGLWRPIHVAACEGMAGSMKVLVDAGCSINVLTGNKMTPLSIALGSNRLDCVKILRAAMNGDELLKNNSLWKVVDPESGQTVLCKILSERSPRMIKALKEKSFSKQELKDLISSKPAPNDPQSLLLVQECLLYWCIRHDYQTGFVTLCTPEIINRETLFMGPSALETAVEFDGALFVSHILKKFISVDESWIRAAAFAKKNESTNILLLLEERISYLTEMKERGYSRLHIAVYDNDPDMVRYILEHKLCDPDGGYKTVGTAFSLAYSQGHMSCVRCLQDNNVNVNTTDRLGQSPLHVAIVNRTEDCIEYLVNNTRDMETVDYMCLSVLALSVMRDCSRACEMIVDRMERLDKYVQAPNSIPSAVGASDPTICSICCGERINCALTCGHMFCMTCADKEVYCYVCRRLITDKIRIFM